MKHYPNKIVKNVGSPKREGEYIEAYKELNPKARRHDNMDIAAVVTKSGQRGHVLLPEGINRSHDNNYHRGEGFISNEDLRKNMKKQ